MQTTTLKKPETLGEIKDFLEIAISKTLSLTPSSFGKFTPSHLPDDYLYDKWLGKEKDFSDVYLNMDPGCQNLFIEYILGSNEVEDYYRSILHHFFIFCWNYDSTGCEDPFRGKYADYLTKLSTGKKNASGVRSMQVIRLFHKLDKNGKMYLTWCAFGSKK